MDGIHEQRRSNIGEDHKGQFQGGTGGAHETVTTHTHTHTDTDTHTHKRE